jgi:DNA-binding MarR family transcriptional regulator
MMGVNLDASKCRCKKFLQKSFTLLRIILRLLKKGYYPTKIARILGKSRQLVRYYVKKLEKMGYVELVTRDAITIYNITQAGQKFLDGIESATPRGHHLRLHNIAFKYQIIKEPSKKVDWNKVVRLRNWGQILGSEMGMTVRKNTDSIEIFCKVVEGDNPYELLFKAREEADRLATHLEQKFDMVLGRGTLSRKPHFGIYDPIARRFAENFQLSDDVAKIDESEGYGEIDWHDPEAAKSYLLMPISVERIRAEVKELNTRLRSLEAGLTTIMQTWNLVGNKLLEILSKLEKGDKEKGLIE